MNHSFHTDHADEASQPADERLPLATPSAKHETPIEPWMIRLRKAYMAGYYKTESAVGDQLLVPWLGKTCGDCPFWSNSICHVFAENRNAMAHTCIYFDPANRAAAQAILDQRRLVGSQQW